MNDWLNRIGYALVVAGIELVLLKYGQFAIAGIVVIFLLFGGMSVLMGHKRLGYGLLIGTVLFALVALLFGWTFMEGWARPEDIFQGKFKTK